MLGILSNFVGYFNKNVNDIVIMDNTEEQYSRFLSYISNDTNAKNLSLVNAGYTDKNEYNDENEYIIFKYKDGTIHQYIYQNNNIYYLNVDNNNMKKILLCEKVSMYSSDFFDYEDGKLNLDFSIGKERYSTTLNISI